MTANKVLGIDLGTTYCCVAVVQETRPEVIPSRGGYRTTPSVFAVTEGGKKLVGHLAKRQAVTNPRNTIYAVKRLIGRRFDSPEVRRALETCPFEIHRGPHDDIRLRASGKDFSPAEVSAFILMEMRRVAQDHIREEVRNAVITVPAYFNDNQRQSTRDAGKIAGLEVLRIINEPTAAALAYGFTKQRDAKIAVYDLGGGTFDISILDVSGGVYEVISTAGDTYLGGEDIDTRIVEHLIQRFQQETGVDLRSDRMALQRLKEAAEKAKCELSTVTETSVSLPFIAVDRSGPRHLNVKLQRKGVEAMSKELVDRTIEICEETMRHAGLKPSDLDEVILVGGQTRMPMVQSAIQGFFGRPPSKGVHPDEAVAIGAALEGASLLSPSQKVLLLDVTPLSLGIATVGGKFTHVVDRNTTVPVQRKRTFTTAADNQTAVKIRVHQGEADAADQNELLGEFILDGIRKAPKGESEIEVAFDLNTDGILKVSAHDLQTGREQAIRIEAKSTLTDEEIRNMAKEAETFELELKA